MNVLAHGLERLGILASADDALRDDRQFYKRYSLHNVSHMLGLDVHDCAQARAETYKFGRLQPGMVLTVEPGLYFQLDDLTVPERYRGIGVRIEDDVVITAGGYENLSAALPSEPDAVEAWVARAARHRTRAVGDSGPGVVSVGSMKTLFLSPPSFDGFDGGAGARYQAKREVTSFWYPTLAGAARRPRPRKQAHRRRPARADDRRRAGDRERFRARDHAHEHAVAAR